MKHAFLWDGVSAASQDLGALPTGSNSVAEDINEGRFIAGHADEHMVMGPLNITHERAFTYHANFGMVALPMLPATTTFASCRAYALNELNASMVVQVVGACDTPSGPHAVRWDVTIQNVPLCRVCP